MKEFFNRTVEFLRDFPDSDTHQLTLFGMSILVCAISDLTTGFVFAILLTLSLGIIAEAAHAFCGKRTFGFLWWEVEYPDLKGFFRQLGKDREPYPHEVWKGTGKKRITGDLDEGNIWYSVAGIVSYYVGKSIILVILTAFNS